MLSLSKLALLVAMVTVMVTWMSHETSATPIAQFPAGMEERSRQVSIAVAAWQRVAKDCADATRVTN